MIRVHYSADWLACGGPDFERCPKVDTEDPAWAVDTAAVALAGLPSGKWQVVHVHTGRVMAEADTAEEAAEYLAEYAEAVDEEARSWSK